MWPLDFISCWQRATQLLHIINIASSSLALTGFPTGCQCQQHWRFFWVLLKERGCVWKPESSGELRKGLCNDSARKDRKAFVWGGSNLPWNSKNISEDMSVEPDVTQGILLLSCYCILGSNSIAVYKANPRSKTPFPLGLLAVHVGGVRRKHTNVLICTSCLKAVLCKSRQWARLVCLKEVMYWG